MLNDIIFYSEQGLQNLAHDQIWKGKGTEKDPFVIENANILGQTFSIKKCSLYISFIKCNFDHTQFDSCKNITLQNCTFETLSLKHSMKIEINNCFISDLKVSHIKQINFCNTVIMGVSTKSRIKNIIFKDCQINNEFINYILKKQLSGFYSKIKEIMGFYIIILLLFVFYRLFWTPYKLTYSDIGSLFIIGSVIIVLLVISISSSICEYFIKKRLPKIKVSREK
ncbi:MAG: hypothetical protein ACFFAV_03675 [Candidatus Hermodarchaeota archaeon]